jgi:predicted HicB family RNase H-like nuclease
MKRRPQKHDRDNRWKQITVRVSVEEYERIQATADAARMSMNFWCVQVLNGAVRSERVTC